MTDYQNSIHQPWFPRHCVISLDEGLPYPLRTINQYMNTQSHVFMCANVANNAINAMMGKWRGSQSARDITQDKKKP